MNVTESAPSVLDHPPARKSYAFLCILGDRQMSNETSVIGRI